MELALLLAIPATVALIVCGLPITAALFGYGRYTPDDVFATSQALAGVFGGLPSYILVKVLTPGYYARQDTKTPVRFAVISMVVNLVLNLALIPTIGHIGPPLATACRGDRECGLAVFHLAQARAFCGRCAAYPPRLAAGACCVADGRGDVAITRVFHALYHW